MAYRLGYRPSPADKVGLGHPHKLSAAPVPERSFEQLAEALDQLNTSSCTANSSAEAIRHAMAKSLGLLPGEFPELPARLFLYFGARAAIAETDRDEGAMIYSIFDFIAKLGFPPESLWPFSDKLADIIRQPDWRAMQAAADQKVVEGAYRIDSVGRERADDVARALGQGATVVWGTSIDDAIFNMENDPDGVWPGVRGAVIGGHAMLLHGHEPWQVGQRKFLCRTSWGPNFAREGSFWVSEAAVVSTHASDFWVVSLSPSYSTPVTA